MNNQFGNMAQSTGKERLEKRRQHIKRIVNEQHAQGVKIQAIIYKLSEDLFLSTRQIENDLYYKGESIKRESKNKY